MIHGITLGCSYLQYQPDVKAKLDIVHFQCNWFSGQSVSNKNDSYAWIYQAIILMVRSLAFRMGICDGVVYMMVAALQQVLTILVIFSVVVVVNSEIVCLEVAVYNYKSPEVSYGKDTSTWCSGGSVLMIHDNNVVLVAPSCCGRLVISSNSGGGAMSLVQA